MVYLSFNNFIFTTVGFMIYCCGCTLYNPLLMNCPLSKKPQNAFVKVNKFLIICVWSGVWGLVVSPKVTGWRWSTVRLMN